jgi:hypothetical protein
MRLPDHTPPSLLSVTAKKQLEISNGTDCLRNKLPARCEYNSQCLPVSMAARVNNEPELDSKLTLLVGINDKTTTGHCPVQTLLDGYRHLHLLQTAMSNVVRWKYLDKSGQRRRNDICESGGTWHRQLLTARNTIGIFGISAPTVRIGRLRILTNTTTLLLRWMNSVLNVWSTNAKEPARRRV